VPKRNQPQAQRAADQDHRAPSAGGALMLLLSTLTGLDADIGTARHPGSAATDGDARPAPDGPQLLVALTQLRRLRDQLARWEPTLIAAARDQGVTWTDLAPALGVSSRQAAEARYLGLNRDNTNDNNHDDDNNNTSVAPQTRQQRVRATRDRRSGDRAVAGWARDNAATLRRLAGQIAALPPPPRHPQARRQRRAQDDEASRLAARVHQALRSDNAADLVGPLLDTQTMLATTHPDLARQVSDLAASTEHIRAADLNRRRTSTNPPPD
jgi:hypothetical protein